MRLQLSCVCEDACESACFAPRASTRRNGFTAKSFGTLLQPILVLAALLLGGLAFAGTLRALKTVLVEVLQRRMFVRTASQLAYSLPRIDAHVRFAGDPIHRFFELFGA